MIKGGTQLTLGPVHTLLMVYLQSAHPAMLKMLVMAYKRKLNMLKFPLVIF